MDCNLSSGKVMMSGGGPYAAADRLHLQQQQPNTNLQQPLKQQLLPPHHLDLMDREVFPLSVAQTCEHGQRGAPPASDYSRRDHHGLVVSTSEDDDVEEGADDHDELYEKGKRAIPWHRMKWTDAMVKLLITIVSYIGEGAASESAGTRRRMISLLQKKGKWKLVSKVMAERGYYVSPQQCEDKFNDLNKRYKRLNEILGRGTSCEVVENPSLLDMMHHISDKAKDDVRKILSSKHLFYEEMCSFHNGNRLHLPADPSLQHLLQQALHSDELQGIRNPQDHTIEEETSVETDNNEDEPYECHVINGEASCLHNRKRTATRAELDAFALNPYAVGDCNKAVQLQGMPVDINQALSEGTKDGWSQKQWMESSSLQLEEQRLQIQAQMLELETQRFKWQQFSKKKDREPEKRRIENENMKLENDHLSQELKRKAFEAGLHQFANGL